MIAEEVLDNNLIFLNNGKRTKKKYIQFCSLLCYWSHCCFLLYINSGWLGCNRWDFCIIMNVSSPINRKREKENRTYTNYNKVTKFLIRAMLECPDLASLQEITLNNIKLNTNIVDSNRTPKYWWNDKIENLMKERRKVISKIPRAKFFRKHRSNIHRESKNQDGYINHRAPLNEVWKIVGMLQHKRIKKKWLNPITYNKVEAKRYLKSLYPTNENKKSNHLQHTRRSYFHSRHM